MRDESMLRQARRLLEAYRSGALGGEKMPEDKNPQLDKSSVENYLYFTLTMSLNYQRSAYALWESALRTYDDPQTRGVFVTWQVMQMTEDELREKLTRYKLALQPNKQPQIWRTLCTTFEDEFSGDVRQMFERNGWSAERTKSYIAARKKQFPYLGGVKICNYWLHVMERYTDARFIDRQNISVAPDTHVIQSSVKLGIISPEEAERSDVRELTAARWQELLEGTEIVPIDMHTPMWLWSRSGFELEI